jgi:GNAT superfamily N-acetyltransferase
MSLPTADDRAHAPEVARICAAYAWQRALGHPSSEDALCRLVVDPAHPDVWDANHASCVRAASEEECARVLTRAEQAFAHCRHRLFVVDPLTPPSFVARLALEDYRELTPTIQMVLRGEVPVRAHAATLRPVVSEEDWQQLAALVRADHQEGARSHDGPLAASVTHGMVKGYRGKFPRAQFFLAYEGAQACAYGAGVVCEDGVGVVEDLFTLPSHRRGGFATALVATAVQHVRTRGCDLVMIGAHASDPPKHLYRALGFHPACLTREYLKQV